MRTIYRCNYTFKGEFGPARESKAFQTEQEAREYAESLEARGYIAVVWRERQVKTGGRWETDLRLYSRCVARTPSQDGRALGNGS